MVADVWIKLVDVVESSKCVRWLGNVLRATIAEAVEFVGLTF